MRSLVLAGERRYGVGESAGGWEDALVGVLEVLLVVGCRGIWGGGLVRESSLFGLDDLGEVIPVDVA